MPVGIEWVAVPCGEDAIGCDVDVPTGGVLAKQTRVWAEDADVGVVVVRHEHRCALAPQDGLRADAAMEDLGRERVLAWDRRLVVAVGRLP